MKLLALEIPDEADQLGPWLERQVVGCDLSGLVAQLSATRAPAGEGLDAILGDQRTAVLQEGLVGLPEEKLRRLLANPLALLELQEAVFIEGGPHWDQLPLEADHRSVSESVQQRVLGTQNSPGAASRGGGFGAGTRLLLALAAALLVGVGFWVLQPPATGGWGFNRSGLLAQSMPADEYLNELADAANDWFNKRPATPDQLAQRLQQFTRGCDTLIAAPHPQLAAEDRSWLVERCRVWRDALQEQMAAVRERQGELAEQQQAADATINKLIDALRTRAQAVGQENAPA